MNDLIRRSDAIKALGEEPEVWVGSDYETASRNQWNTDRLAIETVPSAQRKGKWNCSDDMFEYAICSCCKWDSGEAWEYARKNFKYCPNCGAWMRQDNPSYPLSDDDSIYG